MMSVEHPQVVKGRKAGLVCPVYGGSAYLRAMQLITILNRCHRFPRFVYQHAQFSSDKKSIEISVRPRKGSAAICSRCHRPAPGYDQLPERRFEFIPFWDFWSSCSTPCDLSTAAAAPPLSSKKFHGPTASAHSPRSICFS